MWRAPVPLLINEVSARAAKHAFDFLGSGGKPIASADFHGRRRHAGDVLKFTQPATQPSLPADKCRAQRATSHARCVRALLIVLLLASAAPNAAFSEKRKPNAAPAATPPAATAPQPTAAAPQPEYQVSVEQTLYLIRSTLLTLNDANRSGNYTVLRDLAAPEFQARNTAADLAQIFSDLRRRNFDLFAAAVAAPQLTATPAVDAKRMLRVTGYFPTRPLQINFDLAFQAVGGQWRLFGISVATPEAPLQAQAQTPADTSKPKAPGAAKNR
jgi:hypothetical protein